MMTIDAKDEEAVGHFPQVLKSSGENAPTFLAGYVTTREWAANSREDGLSPGTKEPLFMLIDVAHDNARGATNHVKRAVAAGVTKTQLLEGLLAIVLVGGLLTWASSRHEAFGAFVQEIERT